MPKLGLKEKLVSIDARRDKKSYFSKVGEAIKSNPGVSTIIVTIVSSIILAAIGITSSVNKNIDSISDHIQTVSKSVEGLRKEIQEDFASVNSEINGLQQETKTLYGDVEKLKIRTGFLEKNKTEKKDSKYSVSALTTN